MKSFLVLGLSTFGQHLCRELARLGCDIMVADIDADVVEPMIQYSVSAKICDCTNKEILTEFGVDEFDTCFVCMGGNFTETLETTYLLKELGAKKVITEVNREIEMKFVLSNGGDQALYPEKDLALRVASRESCDSVFDAIEVSGGYCVYETDVPKQWQGKSVRELNIRAKYNINIVAVKKGEDVKPLISPDYVFGSVEHLLIICHEDDVRKLFRY